MEKQFLERIARAVEEIKEGVQDMRKSVASPAMSAPSVPPMTAPAPVTFSMNEDKDLEKIDWKKLKENATAAAVTGGLAAGAIGGAHHYSKPPAKPVFNLDTPASVAATAKPAQAASTKKIGSKAASKAKPAVPKAKPVAAGISAKAPDNMSRRVDQRMAERASVRASMNKEEDQGHELIKFSPNGQWSLVKAEKNPDKEADAKLGEDVEHLVEDHMIENADAEREEGHKIMAKDDHDSNSQMAYGTVKNIELKAKRIKDMIRESGKEAPPWVVSKLAQAKSQVQGVMDYATADDVKKKEGRCWEGYEPTPGKKPYSKGSCQPMKKEEKAKGEKGQPKVAKVMRHFSEGKLHSGKSGEVVTDPQQAKAIAMSMSGLSRKK